MKASPFFNVRWMRCLVVCGIWLLPPGASGGYSSAIAANGIDSSSPSKSAPSETEASPRGFELGRFRIRVYHPVEAQKSTVTFRLHAVVADANAAAFERLIMNRTHKVRDQVIVATRLAPLADYDNPELSEFRQRILLRLRRMLPELVIDDIYVSDFELEVRALGPKEQ